MQLGIKKSVALFLALGVSSALHAQSTPPEAHLELGGIGYETPKNGGYEPAKPGSRSGNYWAIQSMVPFGNSGFLAMDIQSELLKEEKNVDMSDFGPHRASLASFGLHKRFKEGGSLGVYFGVAQTDVDDGAAWGRSGGYMYGLQLMSGGSHRFFTTVGHADITSDFSDDQPDGQFKGGFGEIGLTGPIGSRVFYKVSGGYGSTSRAFHNDLVYAKANYAMGGLKLLFAISPHVYLTAGAEYSKFKSGETSMDRATEAKETRYSFGIVIPLGKETSMGVGALRPLAPPLAPVRAAAWNEFLDNHAPAK